MTHDEMIAVIAAHRDRKTIEYDFIEGPNGWEGVGQLHAFNFEHWQYRVKPEPRTIWVNEYPGGGLTKSHYDSKEEANEGAEHTRIACRKFVEVIE